MRELNYIGDAVPNGPLRLGPLIRVPHGLHVEVNLFNDLEINHTSVRGERLLDFGTRF